MKLDLFNFKCWNEKTITLPTNGILLLNGDSGKGKTTILRAIYWCLYGEGKHVTTHGEKKTSVTLYDNGITICRKTGPVETIVTQNCKQYHSSEAQAIINSIYGTNFLLTSYITQKMTNSFLNHTAGEQLKFIEKIAFGNESPEYIKEKVKLEKSTLRKEIDSIDNQLKAFDRLERKMPQIDVKIENYSKKSLKKCSKKCNTLINTIEECKQTINKLKIDKNQNESNKRLVEEYTQELKRLQKEVCPVPKVSVVEDKLKIYKADLDYLNNNEKLLAHKKCREKNKADLDEWTLTSTKKKNDIQDKLKKIHEKYGTTADILLQINYHERLLELKDTIGDISDLLAEIESYQKVYKCAWCDKCLTMKDDVLCKSNATTIKKADEKKLKQLTDKKTRVEEANRKYKEITDKLNAKFTLKQLTDEYKTINECEYEWKNMIIIPEHIAKEKTRLDIEWNKNEYEWSGCDECNEDEMKPLPRDELVKTITSLELDIKSKKNELKKQEDLKQRISDYEKKIKKIPPSQSEDDFNESIKQKEKVLKKTLEKLHKEEEKKKAITEYEQYLKEMEEYNKWKTSRMYLQLKLNKLRERGEQIDKLLRKIDVCQTKAISNILNTINYYMKEYLSVFFEEHINVELRAFRELKNGDYKPEITILIDHKGFITSIDELSGGETDRLTLSLFLAFNHLSNSNILFLDESLPSLQNSLSSKIIECLRETIADKKLIVMINHNTEEGLFDHVINV